MTWQPIADAPKDGRKLLTWNPGFGLDYLVLYYLGGMWREPINGLGLKCEPTHWMPLPPPPDEERHDQYLKAVKTAK